MKPLVRRKVQLVLDEFHENHPMPASGQAFNFEELKQDILSSLDSFTGPPFTIQRICELLTLPNKHYKRTDKFMRGLEKNVLVVSHIDPALNASSERPPTPPKSIFAADTSCHAFERSLNHSDLSSSPGPSSAGAQVEESFRSRDAFLPATDQQPGTSCAGLSLVASSSKILLPSLSCPNPQSPAPLQQLDSFTTVFSSPPSTPLAVVSNMPPFEPTSSSSSSSSSESSGASSPQMDAEPASPPENAQGHRFASRSSFSEQSPSEQSPPASEAAGAAADAVPQTEVSSKPPSVAEAELISGSEAPAAPTLEKPEAAAATTGSEETAAAASEPVQTPQSSASDTQT